MSMDQKHYEWLGRVVPLTFTHSLSSKKQESNTATKLFVNLAPPNSMKPESPDEKDTRTKPHWNPFDINQIITSSR